MRPRRHAPGRAERPEPARSRGRSIAGFLGSLALAYAAAAAGGAATAQAGAFYAELTLPAWAPPGWLFGPVWTLLYTGMAVAAWRVWRAGPGPEVRAALALYLGQLLANALWSWIFFAWRLGLAAFIWILLLCAVVGATIRAFRRLDRPAALLLWPYLAWLAFAAALALAAWRLNPTLL